MRASSTHDVIYDDVRVPFENFSGAPVGTVPNNGGIAGSIAVAVPALYVGVAQAALAAFVDFARERVPTSLGRPIATLERIQIGRRRGAGADHRRRELVLDAVAAQIDEGRADAAALGLVKLLTSRARDRRGAGPRRRDRQPRAHPQPAVRAAPARCAVRPPAPAAGRRGPRRRRAARCSSPDPSSPTRHHPSTDPPPHRPRTPDPHERGTTHHEHDPPIPNPCARRAGRGIRRR